jgi:hypothetical protein
VLVTPEADGATGPDPRPSGEPPRRSPAARLLWRVGGGLFVAAMLVFGVGQFIVALAHEQRTLDRSFPAAGIGTIEVHNGADGSVEVIGTDTDTIRVRSEVHDGLRKTNHSERVEGDRLVLRSSCPVLLSQHCSVSYEIEAPAGVSIDVGTDGGHLSVSDIDGNVDVTNDAGGIELARIGGLVQAHSDAGGIDAVDLRSDRLTASSDAGSVRVDFDEPPQAVVATSDAGAIEVVVPRGGTYNVTADSDAGSTNVDVDTSSSAEQTIVATTDAGSVVVRYRTSG